MLVLWRQMCVREDGLSNKHQRIMPLRFGRSAAPSCPDVHTCLKMSVKSETDGSFVPYAVGVSMCEAQEVLESTACDPHDAKTETQSRSRKQR